MKSAFLRISKFIHKARAKDEENKDEENKDEENKDEEITLVNDMLAKAGDKTFRSYQAARESRPTIDDVLNKPSQAEFDEAWEKEQEAAREGLFSICSEQVKMESMCVPGVCYSDINRKGTWECKPNAKHAATAQT